MADLGGNDPAVKLVAELIRADCWRANCETGPRRPVFIHTYSYGRIMPGWRKEVTTKRLTATRR